MATKKNTPKPSEIVDEQIESESSAEELLADMPALLPAHRFRSRHRVSFTNLQLDAAKSGAFSGDGALDFETRTKEGIERYQALLAFFESVDEWAESIAIDAEAYAAWAEGKSFDHMMAIFLQYRDALGESEGSES